MRTGKELAGKPIFSITDGRKVGAIKDMYVSDDLGRVIGLYLGHEGLIKRTSFAIRREDVVVLGVDAILVKDNDVVTDDKQTEDLKQWLRVDKLRGREVDTPGGTKVGAIGDIIVDETGQITGFRLGRVFVEGPIAEQKSILREVVIEPGSEDKPMTIDLSKAEGGTPEPAAESIQPEEEVMPEAIVPPEPATVSKL